MEGWQLGLIAVVVVGALLTLAGALKDRRTNQRRRREILAPPDRAIPQFAPDSPAPNYLSELQARRRPAGAQSAELTTQERAELQGAIDGPDAMTVEVGYASPELVTDPPSGWAVLQRPDVLVSDGPILVLRELLGVLERQLPTGRPIVVVAPSIAPELIATFEVNHLQQVITILPVVTGDETVLAQIADATGATPTTRGDLQSGYSPPGQLGSCATWVATPTQSHLLGSPGADETGTR